MVAKKLTRWVDISAVLVLAALSAAPVAANPATGGRCPAGGDAVTLSVDVEGVRSAKGTVTISIYGDRPEDFLAKGKKLGKVRLPAESGTVHGCLSLPHPGVYAFTAYHDENEDRRFSRNFLGLPSEGFAVSNGNASLLGIPSFRESAVTINGSNARITLMMQYP